jgi:hypothetical protein
MDANELVTVFTLKDANKAEIIKTALQLEGIACSIDGEHQAGFSNVFDMDILVPAKDADRARAFIESHERSKTDES